MSNKSSHKSTAGQRQPVESLAHRVQALVDAFHEGSVNAAAADIGIPQRSLARIAAGEVTTPRLPAVQAIARHYLVSVGWLLDGEGEAPTLDLPPERLKLNLLAAKIAGDSEELAQAIRDLPNAPSWALGAFLTGYPGVGVGELFGKRATPQIAAAAELSCRAWRLMLDAMAQARGYPEVRTFLDAHLQLAGLGFGGFATWAVLRRSPGLTYLDSLQVAYEAMRAALPDYLFAEPEGADALSEWLYGGTAPTSPPSAQPKAKRAGRR